MAIRPRSSQARPHKYVAESDAVGLELFCARRTFPLTVHGVVKVESRHDAGYAQGDQSRSLKIVELGRCGALERCNCVRPGPCKYSDQG